uniref:mRNA (guanine-N(7))-methyltransferase n=1 Tax=Anthurium amnicola TaxID=1678845 RepID=A0A1D1ZCH9_9ARAE
MATAAAAAAPALPAPSSSASSTSSSVPAMPPPQQPPPLPPAQPPPSQPLPPPPAPSSSTGPPPFVCRADLPHYRLYDFAKTALIKIFVSPYATVCDLYCGGGADTDKWDEAQIGHYIGIDASTSSISDARETWESQRKPYTAEFLELDPSVLSFESEERARSLLRNVSVLLKPGGYFLGITPDSSMIWTKYQKNVEASHNKGSSMKPNVVPNCIRSENYIINFEAEDEKFPLFGKKYHLKFANDIPSETHCLVHFPSLIRLAREAGLEYVEIQNLTEFYDDNRAQFAGMLFSFVDPRGRLLARSFDILGLYTTFVFQKTDPNVICPILTPMLQDGNHTQEQEWLGSSWRQQTLREEDRNGHVDANMSLNNVIAESDKGILGPGPADLRFSEPY